MKQYVWPYNLVSHLAKEDTRFQDQVLGRTFRPKRKDGTGGWRNLLDEQDKMFTTLGVTKVKSKVRPITGHECPEREQIYSCTLPSTSALDVGGWSTPRIGRFTAGKDLVPIVQEAGWALGPV